MLSWHQLVRNITGVALGGVLPEGLRSITGVETMPAKGRLFEAPQSTGPTVPRWIPSVVQSSTGRELWPTALPDPCLLQSRLRVSAFQANTVPLRVTAVTMFTWLPATVMPET